MVNKKALMYTLGFMLVLVCLSYVSAESSYVFKQGEVIDLKIPVYDDTNAPATNAISCDLNVVSPNQTIIVDSQAMTFNTGGIFSYQIPAMTELGEYSCSMACSNGTVNGFSTFGFDVTPSGKNGNSNIVFFLFVIIMIYAIAGFGFFGKNIPITILGGMAMMGLGVYTINEGIIVYRDWITNYFSYITIGLGALVSIWAIVEQLEM